MKLFNGDCLEVMKELPDNSIDLILTSPPYEDISGAGYKADKKDILFLKLYSQFIDDPKTILYHLEKVYNLAISGRPGPVLLDIPLDVQSSLVSRDELVYYTIPPTDPLPVINLQEVVNHIQKSKKPLILAGHGIRVANQVQEFRNLIQKLNIPIVSTQLANDVIP